MGLQERLDRRIHRPMLSVSSDVGHFDVVDMNEVLEGAVATLLPSALALM
jgi:hypothetical protein